MLSIQEFSNRTGIPKSTLRFYEEKGLLIPNRKEENGYRVYREEQIDLARLIVSLRLANVPIGDIQTYVLATEPVQERMKQSWIRLLNQQKELLDVQIRFLESSSPMEKIFLYERKPERVVWFLAEGHQGEFGADLLRGIEELDRYNVAVRNSYLQYASGTETVKAWIGFGIDKSSNISSGALFEREEMISEALCVATTFQGDFSNIGNVYHSLMKYVSDNGYISVGSLMEKYHGDNLMQVTIMIPVMKLGGE